MGRQICTWILHTINEGCIHRLASCYISARHEYLVIVAVCFLWKDQYTKLSTIQKKAGQKALVQSYAGYSMVAQNPILDTVIYGRPPFVTLVLPPLDSETGWTGELWAKTKFLILEN